MVCHYFIAKFKCIDQEIVTEAFHFLSVKTLLELINFRIRSVANLKITKNKIEKTS